MVSIFNSKEEITPHAANIFVAASQNAIQKRGRFLVALTGGSSPVSIYKLLATPQYKAKIDWENIFVFWGDERWVPLDDERSNAKMSSDYLLNHVGIPKSNLFPMYKEGFYRRNMLLNMKNRLKALQEKMGNLTFFY